MTGPLGMRLVLFILFFFTLTDPSLHAVEAEGQKPQPAAGSSSELEEAPPEEAIFSFLRGLPEGHVERWHKGKVTQGAWTGNGFQFGDSGANVMEVFPNDQTKVNGKSRAAIWILARAGHELSLTFPNVPPARSLRLFYALPDYVFELQGKKIPSFVQIEILIGRKKVFEGQTNTKGWKEKTIDLTLPYLLQRDYRVIMKVRSLDANPMFLAVYGFVQ